MGIPFTPNGVRVEPIFQQLGQTLQNVFYVTKGSPATTADLTALAGIYENWERNTARTRRNVQITSTRVECTALDAAGAPQVIHPYPLPAIVGTVNSAVTPVLTAAITLRTGLAGRSYRGRLYWVGIGTNQQATVETMTSAFQADMVTIHNTLKTALAAGGWTWVVMSYYSGIDINGKKIPRLSGLMTPVTTFSCDQYVDTQRHRKIRPST